MLVTTTATEILRFCFGTPAMMQMVIHSSMITSVNEWITGGIITSVVLFSNWEI